MIIAVNYANQKFKRAQKFNSRTAIRFGADRVIEYTPDDIDADFYKKNKEVLSAKKGNGYYLWKPYFLNKAYQELQEGDYLIYTDSGAIYVDQIQKLIDCMEREHQDIMIFSLEKELLERKYTKKDAFILMDCDSEEYWDTPQSIGGYVLCKKSPFVEKFLREDLEYAQDPRIISEIPNTQGKEDASDFIMHRHDQSVWSLMSKKYQLKRFRDPSQFGMIHEYEEEVAERSTYPQVIDSTRMNAANMLEVKWRRSKPGDFCHKVKVKFFG